MIKLTYRQINSDGFNKAINYLSSQSDFGSFQAAYNMAKLARKFEKELRQARASFSTWTKDYVAKTEDGTPIMSTDSNGIFPFQIVEGKTEEFSAKVEDFLNTEVTIEVPKLTAEQLGKVSLSPNQILALEPILDSSSLESLY